MPLMFQPLARYFDFQGRSRRSEYWLWVLLQVIISIVFTILQASFKATDGGMGMGIALIRFCIWLGLIIPSIAVAVRRFHDIGRTGWWILFQYAVMLVASIIYFSINGSHFVQDMQALSGMAGKTNMQPAEAFALLQPLFTAFTWILLPTWLASIVTFVFHVTDGTPSPNRFGNDPKGRGNANVF